MFEALRTQSGRPTDTIESSNMFDRFRASASLQDQAQSLSTEQRLRQSVRDAQVHQPPGGPNSLTPLAGADITTPQMVPATMADETTRVGLARDMQTAGRVGLELAGGLGGAGLGRQIASRTGLRGAAKAAIESAFVGAGEGAGALGAQAFDPLEDPFGNAARVALFATVGDGLASTLVAGVNKARRGGSAIESGARSAIRVLGEGNLPTTGRLTKNRAFDMMENVVENSLSTGGMVTRQNERAALKAREVIEEYISTYTKGASKQDIDNLVRDVVDNRLDVFKSGAESLYGQVDELAPIGVDTTALIDIRNRIVSENQKGGLGEGLNAIVVAIDRTLGVPKNLRGVDPNRMITNRGRPRQGTGWDSGALVIDRDAAPSITFREAQKLRSDILSAQRSVEDVFASQLEGATKRVGPVIDDAMDAAAAAEGNEAAFELWRVANAYWKDGAESFSESVMRSLANARPDDLAKTIMQGNRPQQIQRFRRLVLGGAGGTETTADAIRKKAKATLSSKTASAAEKQIASSRLAMVDSGVDAWDKFTGSVLMNVIRGSDSGAGLTSSAVEGTRTIVASSALKRLSNMGEETLKELFPTPAKKHLAERLLRIMELTQSGTGLGVGTFAVQMAQAGAAVTLLFNTVTGDLASDSNRAAAFILFGPVALGRVMRNEKFVRWATIGSRAKPGSPAALRAFTQMAIIASQEGARVRGFDGNLIVPNEDTKASRDLKDFNAVAISRGLTENRNRTQGVR